MGDLFKSKKFQAAIIGVVAAAVGHFKMEWQPIAEQVMWLMMAFIGGQGLADLGKSKAQIENEVIEE